MSLLKTLLFSVFATKAAASCAYGTHLLPRAEGGETVEIKDFGYSGGRGPASWHVLDPATNFECAEGKNQSPINLVSGTYTETPGSRLSIHIPDFSDGATFENIGTAVEIVGDGGNLTLPSSNKTFEFKQFHFHLPSEHLDNGTSMAMEAHFVFQAADTEIAVLGVYIDVGSESSKDEVTSYRTRDNGQASQALETIFASVGEISSPGTATTTAAFAMSDLVNLLSSTTFKSYSGSLTTPPCSEGVHWNVASDTLSVSLDTYKSAREVIGFNSRFAQNAPGQTNVMALAMQSTASNATSA